MPRTAVLSSVLLVALAMTGCFGGDGDGTTTTTTTTGTNTGTGTTTTTTQTGTGGGDEFVPVEETISVTLSCVQCSGFGGPEPSASWNSGSAGVDSGWIEITEEMHGRRFNVDSTGGDPDVAFMSSCEVTATFISASLESGPESGKVPTDAGCLVVWEFVGGPSDITIKIS